MHSSISGLSSQICVLNNNLDQFRIKRINSGIKNTRTFSIRAVNAFVKREMLKDENPFKIIKEELKFSRYIQVYNRVVELPHECCRKDLESSSCFDHPCDYSNDDIVSESSCDVITQKKVVEYDIVSAKSINSHFCCVVPFHSRTKRFTLLTEYAQGANHMAYTFPCGGFSSYHKSLEDCAIMELSEEARLKNGKLIKLISDDHPGLLEVKWCKNRFTPFLVIDPETDPNPHPRDLEEYIQVHNVDIAALKHIMYSGDMMLPSIVSCSMAIDYLKENGYL